MKPGEKYIIRYAYGLRIAEILNVYNNKVVSWRHAFDGGEIGFLGKLFGFYMTGMEEIEDFKRRILS